MGGLGAMRSPWVINISDILALPLGLQTCWGRLETGVIISNLLPRTYPAQLKTCIDQSLGTHSPTFQLASYPCGWWGAGGSVHSPLHGSTNMLLRI